MATETESTLSPRTSGVATSPNGAKSPATISTGADASPAPAGFHSVRRAVTVDEGHGGSGFNTRWRPTSGDFNSRLSFDGDRRRSSTFSDFSFSEAKRNLQEDVFNPGGAGLMSNENRWTWVPLLFALLPAFGGMVHTNGAAFVSDIMLLGLAGVFLNWSVTQPWVWYQFAQEVRVREEMVVEMALEDDSDLDGGSLLSSPHKVRGLDDVPEEEGTPEPNTSKLDLRKASRRALDELYLHEVAALFMAFVAPILAAGILHMVRTQLSRPSEGWVSNFHLTVFCLAAEITPLGHAIKLVRARTLHLQRVVHSNPYHENKVSPAQLEDLAKRTEDLEARMVTISETTTTAALTANDTGLSPAEVQRLQTSIARGVRNSLQPDIDALNRAVRRYEKKATVLASVTEARMGAFNTRLNDAISLAAAATKVRTSQWKLFSSMGKVLADWAVWLLVLPIHAALGMCTLPLRTMAALLGSKRRPREELRAGMRAGAGKKADRSTRGVSADRLPSRLAKR
ncbi:hypothetical protein B0T14DRAFT_169348 [Immersiella caudata]|uniref:Uncharacterized protein n=1 Tax=Immersiella caudata TaxID=314043 RepID=A0AA39WX33_9PEZI|nr:hypothetical protein B0T14DRAFT_169348 [Immersiella caudata]